MNTAPPTLVEILEQRERIFSRELLLPERGPLESREAYVERRRRGNRLVREYLRDGRPFHDSFRMGIFRRFR